MLLCKFLFAFVDIEYGGDKVEERRLQERQERQDFNNEISNTSFYNDNKFRNGIFNNINHSLSINEESNSYFNYL